tara:strand:+ start:10030 stop:11127 length:1098 start_codon:yes stop_codon:yes gene_type:complete
VKKVLFLFDSRATFSYSNNVIKHLNKKKILIQTIVTGNYLDHKLGVGTEVFKKNKIKITKKIKFKSPNNKKSSWSSSLGDSIKKYSAELLKLKPDLVVLTGDRIETLGFCIACSYMNIPIAHIQAGDKSGHVDDLARAAISKFANIHFASCKDSCDRLLSWGENKKNIFNMGAPQLDDIFKTSIKKIKNRNKVLIIFHPVLSEVSSIDDQVKNIFNALKKNIKKNIIWIYPNNDFGYSKIINQITKFKEIKIIKNLDRDKFLVLLSKTKLLIGNSSCGILEAPSLKIPVINIGSRQNGRPIALNIINSNYSEKSISSKIKYALKNSQFKKNILKTKNLYFKKNSGLLIANKIFFLIDKVEKFKKY